METAIKIDHLCKKYKDVYAVRDLSLEIASGETFALLGVNGAGKSTTVKMLCGLTSPTSGDATVYGRSIVTDVYGVKSIIDVSMQETAIARNLTVLENLKFYAEISGMDKSTAEAKIAAIVQQFGFEEVLHKRAKTLSGGWQRKLSIAPAIMSEPKVLFLDEPTLGLDVLARRELWHIIEGLKGKTTIVLTTHYMEEAQAMSDRIGIMKKGRLLVVDTADEIIARTGAANFEDAFVSVIEKEGY